LETYLHALLTSALGGGEVSFTLRPLYTREKSSRYPLKRRLDAVEKRKGRGVEEKNPCLFGTESWSLVA